MRGDAGLALVHEFMPEAVVLSTELPQLDGEAVLDHLKRHPQTRHIPVYVLAEDDRSARVAPLRARSGSPTKPRSADAARSSVFGELGEFLDRRTRSVLVVEDDEGERDALDAS